MHDGATSPRDKIVRCAQVTWILAQNDARTVAATEILWILGVLCALAVVVVIVILILRKALLSRTDSAGEPAFSLADLRRLRDEGAITEEEFETARAKLIAAGRAVLQDPDAEAPESANPAQTGPDEPAEGENFSEQSDNGDDPPPPRSPA